MKKLASNTQKNHLVGPPLGDLLDLLVPHHLHHVRRWGLAGLLALGDPEQIGILG